jgi:hypothetical protein
MSRNRTIYQVLALYASQVAPNVMQTGENTVRQLNRVQTFDEDFSRNFTDINQFGNLAAIDRIETEAPSVSASMSYYLTNGINEKYLGLTVAPSGATVLTSCVSGLLTKVTDEKNYYLLIADEGNDAAGYNGANSGVIGIGNGFLTSYSINAAVGELATANVDLEGLNIRVYGNANDPSGVEGPGVSAVDGSILGGVKFLLPSATSMTGAGIPTALQPGDIMFQMTGALGFNNADLKVQDFSLSFDLSRTPLQKLGTKFAFSREIDFPVTATLEVNADVGDLADGNLADLLCNNPEYNFEIVLYQPGCGASKPAAMIYQFKGAKLVTQNFTSNIGDNASMSATYEVQIGGPQDFSRGVFISGSYTNAEAYPPIGLVTV